MGIEGFLGLSDTRTGLLAEARQRWVVWSRQWPALTAVPGGLDGVRPWLRTAELDECDDVLVALARLGAADGPDDAAAAATLAWVLLPGAHRLRAGLKQQARYWDPHRADLDDVVDQAIASQLWIEVRTTVCHSGRRVAALVLANTRFRAAESLRLGVRFDAAANRAGVAVEAADPAHMPGIATAADQHRSSDALWDVLEWAYRESVITPEDGALLLALAEAATAADTGVVSRPGAGLLGRQATEMTARQMGIGASTVRRRASRTLEALRGSTRAGDPRKGRTAVSTPRR